MKIAIAGYGLEGKANFSYWSMPGNTLTIVDERESIDDLPMGVSTILGEDAFTKLDGFDLVVRTAGLAPSKIVADGKIWSATNEFFDKCPVPIIGVTGTKGKGTTASLIASIAKAAGKKVHLVGNIGAPALEVLGDITPDDIVVYELSSFQLWDLEKSPHVAVVLMIEPDHLDIHASFEEYIAAKANIRRYQQDGDYCVYHPTNEWSHQIATESGAKGTAARYGIVDDGQAYVKENTFFVQDTAICSVDALQIPGTHNQDNSCAAISASIQAGIGYEVIEQGLRSFSGLEHRLKFVKEVNGVKYYDDSIATTPGSAIAAMKAFSQPMILILGGSSKGADFTELAKVASTSNVKHTLLIGEEATTIAPALEASGVAYTILEPDLTMSDTVTAAANLAVPGNVVVLSPACASFGMFKNYADRGNQFIAAVQQLA